MSYFILRFSISSYLHNVISLLIKFFQYVIRKRVTCIFAYIKALSFTKLFITSQ